MPLRLSGWWFPEVPTNERAARAPRNNVPSFHGRTARASREKACRSNPLGDQDTVGGEDLVTQLSTSAVGWVGWGVGGVGHTGGGNKHTVAEDKVKLRPTTPNIHVQYTTKICLGVRKLICRTSYDTKPPQDSDTRICVVDG